MAAKSTDASRFRPPALLRPRRNQRRVHQTGYALVDQELEIGLQALGVPVRNRSGVAVAGLSISFLEAQLTTERIIERYLGPLQDAARQITESLPA
jgi:IclR family pca regulon transcriptional regulator